MAEQISTSVSIFVKGGTTVRVRTSAGQLEMPVICFGLPGLDDVSIYLDNKEVAQALHARLGRYLAADEQYSGPIVDPIMQTPSEDRP